MPNLLQALQTEIISEDAEYRSAVNWYRKGLEIAKNEIGDYCLDSLTVAAQRSPLLANVALGVFANIAGLRALNVCEAEKFAQLLVLLKQRYALNTVGDNSLLRQFFFVWDKIDSGLQIDKTELSSINERLMFLLNIRKASLVQTSVGNLDAITDKAVQSFSLSVRHHLKDPQLEGGENLFRKFNAVPSPETVKSYEKDAKEVYFALLRLQGKVRSRSEMRFGLLDWAKLGIKALANKLMTAGSTVINALAKLMPVRLAKAALYLVNQVNSYAIDSTLRELFWPVVRAATILTLVAPPLGVATAGSLASMVVLRAFSGPASNAKFLIAASKVMENIGKSQAHLVEFIQKKEAGKKSLSFASSFTPSSTSTVPYGGYRVGQYTALPDTQKIKEQILRENEGEAPTEMYEDQEPNRIIITGDFDNVLRKVTDLVNSFPDRFIRVMRYLTSLVLPTLQTIVTERGSAYLQAYLRLLGELPLVVRTSSSLTGLDAIIGDYRTTLESTLLPGPGEIVYPRTAAMEVFDRTQEFMDRLDNYLKTPMQPVAFLT